MNHIKFTEKSLRQLKPKAQSYTVQDSKESSFFISISAQGKKTFYVKVDIEGQRKTKKLGFYYELSIRQARQQAQELKQAWFLTKDDISSSPKFEDFVQGPSFKTVLSKYKPSTQASMQRHLDKELIPLFGKRALHQIKYQDVFAWFEKRSIHYPGGANRILDILIVVFKQALLENYCSVNPAVGVKRNPTKDCTRFLSREELKRLSLELNRRKGFIYRDARQCADIIYLLLFTGCRLSEIINMKLEDIQGSNLHLRDSKTGERIVPLNQAALTILRPYIAAKRKKVFLKSNRKMYISEDIQHFWYRVRKKVNIEDVRIHDLRHTFASYAVMQGCPLPMLSKILGHKRFSTTLRYTHVSDPMVIEQAEQVGNHMNDLLTKSSYERHIEVLKAEFGIDMSI
tara:strand:- start:2277 stop:3476 length:1200 start_codon:yes stop_codon:yes gene_type:complete